MARFDSKARHIALSVVLSALIMSAGCNSIISEGGSPSPTIEEPSQQVTATPAESTNSTNSTNLTNWTSSDIAANGTDIRSVTIPENYTNTHYGEIDGHDPVINGTERYYEEILFTAEAGDIINVSMSSIAHDPELRLRSPNGTTMAIDDDGGDGNNARFELLELNQTGQYTLVAAAAEPNTGFDYTLTVKKWEEPRFYRPMESWDEDSQYAEFTGDYLQLAQEFSGGPETWANDLEDPQGNLTGVNYTINTEEDYAVVTYQMDEDALTSEVVDVDAALQNAYWGLYDAYANADDSPENASWAPDRIYHRAINYDENLYRTSYIETEWAEHYAENREGANARLIYASQYYATERFGPTHANYTQGGEYSLTASEFPEYYDNVTVSEEVDTDN